VLRPLELHDTAVAQAVTKTVIGTVVGTPLYMAPEQAFGVADLDTRADIWAAGIVLYELLTGTTPFADQSFPQIVESMVLNRLPPPSRHRPGLAPVFDRIVMKALAKERDDRFQTAAEMRSELMALTGAVARQPKVESPAAAAAAVKSATTVAPAPGPHVPPKPSRWSVAPSKPVLDAAAFAALDGGELISLDGLSAVKVAAAANSVSADSKPRSFHPPEDVFEPELDHGPLPELAFDPRPQRARAPRPAAPKTMHPAVFTVLLVAAVAAVGFLLWKLGLL